MPKVAKIAITICSGLGMALALAVLFVFNPAQCAFYPECQFHRWTGLLCPGCGGLRAMYELLHGQLALAFRFNPLFISVLPLLGAWVVRGMVRKLKNEPAAFEISLFWIWLVIAVVVMFGVVRNLPFGPFAPLPS